MLVNSVWAPGESRPMCRQVACREGTRPLPYLTLRIRHMRHMGPGILGPQQRWRVYATGLPAVTAYMLKRRVDPNAKACRWATPGGWRPEHGVILDGPLRGVWECACGWYVDDASEDVRRNTLASALGMRPASGPPRGRPKRR